MGIHRVIRVIKRIKGIKGISDLPPKNSKHLINHKYPTLTGIKKDTRKQRGLRRLGELGELGELINHSSPSSPSSPSSLRTPIITVSGFCGGIFIPKRRSESAAYSP